MGSGSSKEANEEELQELSEKCSDFVYKEDSSFEIRRNFRGNEGFQGLSTKFPRRETLIIFDWDDTLLCTSALHQRCLNEAAPLKGQLENLESTVGAILQAAMRLGDTVIVTNGKPSWVEDSCQRFCPGLLPTLDQLTVISARSQFENLYPDDPFAWKRQAFQQLVECRYREVPEAVGMNLVVLGDSPAEIEAARRVAAHVGWRASLKTVKFRPAPSCEQLLGQLRKVKGDLRKIVQEARGVTKVLVPRDALGMSTRASSEANGWRYATLTDPGCYSW